LLDGNIWGEGRKRPRLRRFPDCES
jgi:hypothetical protein